MCVTRIKDAQHSKALFLHLMHSEIAVEACGYSESGVKFLNVYDLIFAYQLI